MTKYTLYVSNPDDLDKPLEVHLEKDAVEKMLSEGEVEVEVKDAKDRKGTGIFFKFVCDR